MSPEGQCRSGSWALPGGSAPKRHPRRQRPVPTGPRRALGELATCSFCLAQWVGTGLFGALLLRPRQTRVAAGLLAMLALDDAVQVGQETLLQAA